MVNILVKINKKLISYYAIILFFILWEAAPRLGWANPQFIPPLSKVLSVGWQLILKGELFIQIAVSMQRALLGFLLAAVIGIPLGFILGGWFPRIARFLRPLMTALSQINAMVLFPLFLILFGIGEGGKISIIFWSAVWPLLFTTITGVQQVDPLLIKSAKSMSASGFTIFFKVILPGASQYILTGIKTGSTMAFMMLIGAESFGADSGLGWMIHNSEKNNTIPRLYMALITIAGIGLLINYLLEWLEKELIIWKEPAN